MQHHRDRRALESGGVLADGAIVARRLGLIEEQDGGEDASGKPERHPVVLRVVWDGASAQIIGIDKETVY